MKMETEEGKIRFVEISNDSGRVTLFPREEMSIARAAEITPHIEYIEKMFNIDEIRKITSKKVEEFPWTEAELKNYAMEIAEPAQKVVLQTLVKNTKGIKKAAILKALEGAGIETMGHTLDGIWSCLTRRSKWYGNKERFWDRTWDDQAGDWVYTLKPQYHKILRELP